MKKLVSLALACITVFAMLSFAGCGKKENYPVTIATNTVIENEPKNIVVLDPTAADIIDYVGYIGKLVARSDEVNQEQLSVAPSVGKALSPNIEGIESTNPDLVFIAEETDSNVKKSLTDKGIKVLTMSKPKTKMEVETYYKTIGKVFGGAVDGLEKGEKAYRDLIDKMDKIKRSAESVRKSDVPYEVCYLYNENGKLKMMTNGTYGDMLMGYTGAVNVAVNVTDNSVEASTLRVSNPDFIFYDDEATLEYIKSNELLSALNAVKDNKMLKITADEMNRQGNTAIATLEKMVGFMYPELAKNTATNDEAVKEEAKDSKKADDKKEESKVEEATKKEAKSVADDYKIKIDDEISLKYEDDNDDVKAMQQRLYDLGYVDDKDNITGYYGDVSKKAVSEFQKANKIEESGNADNKTLTAMFMDDAVKK